MIMRSFLIALFAISKCGSVLKLNTMDEFSNVIRTAMFNAVLLKSTECQIIEFKSSMSGLGGTKTCIFL